MWRKGILSEIANEINGGIAVSFAPRFHISLTRILPPSLRVPLFAASCLHIALAPPRTQASRAA